MSEPNKYERIAESLKQARRLEADITPESMEENLRWLVQLAVPEVPASEALRQRVQALTAVPAAAQQPAMDTEALTENRAKDDRRPRSSLWPRFPAAHPGWRRILVGAIPLTIASLALFFLLAAPAPAGVLERVLSAMAKVRSAHCTGRFISYVDKDWEGHPVPGRMQVQWWYQAPDRYRKSMGPEVLGWNREPGTLIVQGQRGVFISHYDSSSSEQEELSRPQVARWLSPLDFFSQTGILDRAQREKNARVSTQEGTYDQRPVKIVTVEVVQPESRGTARQRWVLYVDPASDRIVRSHLRQDWRREDGVWKTLEEETLDHFEYDVAVKPSLFQEKSLAQNERQPGTSPSPPARFGAQSHPDDGPALR
jgi:hypothetical protein